MGYVCLTGTTVPCERVVRGWIILIVTLHGGVYLDSVHPVGDLKDHRTVHLASFLCLGYNSMYIHACYCDLSLGGVSQGSRRKSVLMLQGETGTCVPRIHSTYKHPHRPHDVECTIEPLMALPTLPPLLGRRCTSSPFQPPIALLPSPHGNCIYEAPSAALLQHILKHLAQ